MEASPIVKRIRKLLSLAADKTNPHESKSARLRARSLMKRHRLTQDDVSEDVWVVVSGSSLDPCRKHLAQVAALGFGCGLDVNDQSGEMAFKGRQERVRAATKSYQNLSKQADEGCKIPRDLPPDGSAAWRFCFWLGFFSIVDQRLRERNPPPKPAAAVHVADDLPPSTQKMPAVATEARSAIEKLLGSLNSYSPYEDAIRILEHLRAEAYAHGREVGRSAAIEDLRDTVFEPRALLT